MPTNDVIDEKVAPTTGISGNAIAALLQAIIGQKTQSSAQGTNSSATSGTNVSSGTTSHTGDTAGLEQILQQILDPNNLQNLTASLFAKGAAQVPALTSQYANATGTRVGGNTMLSQSLAELNQTLAQSIAQAVVQQQQTGVQAGTAIAQNKSTGTNTGNQQTTGQAAGTENKTGTSTTGPKTGLKSLALPLALGVGVNKLSKVDLGDIWDNVTGAFGGSGALPSTFGSEGALSGDAMGLPFGEAGGPGASALDAGSSAIGGGSASISDQVFSQLVANMTGEAPVVAGTQVADAGTGGTATDAGSEGIGNVAAEPAATSPVNATAFADSYDGAAFAGANEAVTGSTAGAGITDVSTLGATEAGAGSMGLGATLGGAGAVLALPFVADKLFGGGDDPKGAQVGMNADGQFIFNGTPVVKGSDLESYLGTGQLNFDPSDIGSYAQMIQAGLGK